MINELSQSEFEGLELRAAQIRDEFFCEVSKDRNLSRLLAELLELQKMCIDARRARREAEILEGAQG